MRYTKNRGAWRNVISGATVLLLLGCSTPTPNPPLVTVEKLDLQRYSGTWFEIARYENRFEKGCVGASAHYALEDDAIRVTNRCFDADGIQSGEARGSAYVSGEGKLRVSFFWPFYGNYWVLELADDYRYSVIGDPSRRYFWILARTPTLVQEDLDAIMGRMQGWGYDPSLLYWCRNRAATQ
ncbi:MAG: lipocalin family protein [Campylobacterales bacterium]|nr:lipocalin family protein [Campylobacterales bacterium]